MTSLVDIEDLINSSLSLANNSFSKNANNSVKESNSNNNNNNVIVFKQNTFRRFGIKVYCKTNNSNITKNNNGSDVKEAIVDTKGYRLSVLPFFFKNRVNFLPKQQQQQQQQSSSPIRTTSIPVPLSYNPSEDAGIPTQLNQPIFDILSKAKYIATQTHENICEFIAAEPSTKHHDQILVISEDYETSLSGLLKDGPLTSEKIGIYSYQILKGLVYLHQNRITHRNLSTENIKLDSNNDIKLSNYSLYYLSNQGENVSFPIGNLCNLSAESILSDRDLKGSSNPKCDVWSLGCIILEMIFGQCLWYDKDPSVVLNRLLYLSNLPSNQTYNVQSQSFESIDINNSTNSNSSKSISSIIDSQANMKRFLNNLPSPGLHCLPDLLVQFINVCLTVNSERRPSSAELLEHPYFDSIRRSDRYAPTYVEKPSVKSLELPDDLEAAALLNTESIDDCDIFSGAELYYLWRLAGGDIEKELVAQGLANPSPSVHKLPLFVPLIKTTSQLTSMSNSMGDLLTVQSPSQQSPNSSSNNIKKKEQQLHTDYRAVLYNHKTCTLSVDRIVERIRQAYAYRHEILEAEGGSSDGYLFSSNNGININNNLNSSGNKRNPDEELEYQIVRLAAFHDALYEYAFDDAIQAQPQIIRLAKQGIPNILRGDIWAAILGVVHSDAVSTFRSINLDTRGPNDKQFELDIPRCHQYHPLLSSPSGHTQLFRILKAWSLLNIDKGCYWQGLDSVAAPFVVHCFYDEPKAFACLKSFVDKYLSILYVPNNYAALNEIMLTYSQLLSYHDPELSIHLYDVQLEPNLYAIPWFITIFAHLLPIDKVDILWDTILLGPSSLPFFFAVSIMIQFRSSMLKSSLENCIKTISKIPSVDIDQCVNDALRKFNSTPLSTTISKSVSNIDEELWWMQEVPIEKKKQEFFPRIGIHDLINSPNSKILDIRPLQQFQQCHYPNSVHINYTHTPQQPPPSHQPHLSHLPPHQQQQQQQQQQQPQQPKTKPFNTAILEPFRGHPIVVIAPRGSEGVDFCNQLVRWKFPFVALLNGGMDALEHGASTLLITTTKD